MRDALSRVSVTQQGVTQLFLSQSPICWRFYYLLVLRTRLPPRLSCPPPLDRTSGLSGAARCARTCRTPWTPSAPRDQDPPPYLRLQDQRRCESLLLLLRVAGGPRLAQSSLSDISERLSSSYRSVSEFKSDVRKLFSTLQDDDFSDKLREEVRRRWKGSSRLEEQEVLRQEQEVLRQEQKSCGRKESCSRNRKSQVRNRK
ncbi:hypothetical protein CesoFtcFv8_022588 [Champsocephalus esox]|uniref:Uncharacterized protein n=1 Tax=Champsocephalus esox TaxID=159716 RepID=A0AAN8B6G8_9TELE|nr:hypothetical protein CesoFtcFv8_022588 [Champsocephalus esox]